MIYIKGGNFKLNQVMIFVTHIEITPNPNALKYVLNQSILEQGFCEYRNISECQDDQLAQELFKLGWSGKSFLCEELLDYREVS